VEQSAARQIPSRKERSVSAKASQALSLLELLAGFELGDLERVTSATTATRTLVEGEVLCREGQVADRWWIVTEGVAEVTTGGLYVGTIGPGETVGELALLDGEPRYETVTAVTGLTVEEVDGAQFVNALLETPGLTMALLRQTAVRLRRSNKLIAEP
jgi:CRP/FNR family transcriptional regulator, cyclic AMP receptor protein